MLRSKRLMQLFLAVVAIVTVPAMEGHAQRDDILGDLPKLPNVELPFQIRSINVSPSGKYAICSSVASSFKDKVSRVCVVDLDTMDVLPIREYENVVASCITDSRAFVISRDQAAKVDSLYVFSLPDFEVQDSRVLDFQFAFVGIQVVADKLLSTTDGRIRLSLDTLEPSQEWTVERPGKIRRVAGNWLIDEIVYDASLSKPVFVPNSLKNPPFDRGGPWWGRYPKANSHEYPVVIQFSSSGKDSNALELHHLGGGVLGSLSLGSLSSSNCRRFMRGKRVVIKTSRRIFLWDLNEYELEKLQSPIRLTLNQGMIVVPSEKPSEIQFRATGGSGTYEFHLSYPSSVRNAAAKQLAPGQFEIDLEEWIGQGELSWLQEHPEGFRDTLGDDLIERLQLPSTGTIYVQPFKIYVKDKDSGRSQSVDGRFFTALPQAKYSALRSAGITKGTAAQAERDVKSQRGKEAEERRMQKLLRRQEQWETAGAWMPTAIAVGAAVICCAPFWLSFAFVSRAARRTIAVIMCLASFCPWVALIALRFAGISGLFDRELTAEEGLAILIPVAIFLVSQFVLTFLTAVPAYTSSRGRSTLLGFVLGFLGPLGLGIAVLLPSVKQNGDPVPVKAVD